MTFRVTVLAHHRWSGHLHARTTLVVARNAAAAFALAAAIVEADPQYWGIDGGHAECLDQPG